MIETETFKIYKPVATWTGLENESGLSSAISQTLEIGVVNFWQTFQGKLLSTASTILLCKPLADILVDL